MNHIPPPSSSHSLVPSKPSSKTHPKLLVIGDELASCKLTSDTSIALCQGALNIGYQVFWATPEQLVFESFQVVGRNLTIIHEANTIALRQETCPTPIALKDFDMCLIRKDPPFDESYVSLCWQLQTLGNQCTIWNRPSSLLTHHEKALPFEGLNEGFFSSHDVVPTFLTHAKNADQSALQEFLNSCEENFHGKSTQWVAKPWLGHGGRDVTLYATKRDLCDNIYALSGCMIQPYLTDLEHWGDRRVLLVHGEVFGHFIRTPAKGKIASNLAQGGSASLVSLTPEQSKVVSKVSRFLKHKNIALAGLDLINTRIGEINITSPTGLRSLETLQKKELATSFFALLAGGAELAQRISPSSGPNI